MDHKLYIHYAVKRKLQVLGKRISCRCNGHVIKPAILFTDLLNLVALFIVPLKTVYVVQSLYLEPAMTSPKTHGSVSPAEWSTIRSQA